METNPDLNSSEMPNHVPGVFAKILAVMSKIDTVAKRGRNDYHGYDYVTEADLIEAVRAEMIAQGLVVLPSLVYQEEMSVDKGIMTKIRMDYRIVDTEDGSVVSCVFPGSGQDAGDKGVYKALTGANKYFLMKTFQIATGDDPERETAQASARPGSTNVVRQTGPAAAPARNTKTVVVG